MNTVSVIIPAYNAARTLPQALAALAAAEPPPFQIIVVDDASTDDTAALARAAGVCVLSLTENSGAAVAKNRGAQAANGDLLYFTDADIVPPPDAIARITTALTAPIRHGVVGVLAEHIPHKNWASQFKNLWMNFTYTRFVGVPRIGLFYTSVAAMRRDRFLELGGFDENYRGASIAEDTEFGQRAWGANANISLDPQLAAIHLKRYTISTVLHEDFKRSRALLLMRLRKRNAPFFTSVPLFYQLAVPTLYLGLLTLLGALIFFNPLLFVLAIALSLVFFLLNLPLLSYLYAKRGLMFTVRSALFLPLDVFTVGLGMLSGLLNYLRGIRY